MTSETLRLSRPASSGQPFLVAGSRAYLIGDQDGSFSPLGFHLAGEMGGVWAPPVRLFKGFGLFVDDTPLPPAEKFTIGPFWVRQEFVLPGELTIFREQFAPDDEAAAVIHLTIRSARQRTLRLRFVIWPSLERAWPRHSSDAPELAFQFLNEPGAWAVAGSDPTWCAVAGGDSAPADQARYGNSGVVLEYRIDVPAGGDADLNLTLAGDADRANAIARFERVAGASNYLRSRKSARYTELIARSSLRLPDPSIERAWNWIKCNYDWLTLDLPGTGRGTVAGAPDFMWWFGCDTCFSVLGSLVLGQPDTALSSLDLIRELSLKSSPELPHVIHEANARGEIVHPGMTEETPLFVSAVWNAYCWTGDDRFLRRSYDFCRTALLDTTVRSHCHDGTLLPFGYGITEIPGFDLQCIDCATYAARALGDLQCLAEAMGDSETMTRCRELSARARQELEEGFWLEKEGLYGDFRASPSEMIDRLNLWIAGAEDRDDAEAVNYLRHLLAEALSDPEPKVKRPWLCGNWTVACPLTLGLSHPDRAQRALSRLRGPEFIASWGMRVGKVWPSRTTMSINTGELAIAELIYGCADRALALLRSLTDTLEVHMPGAISEYLPDSGCFVQAWSGYAVAWPIAAHLFGIQPNAARRTLILRPKFPTSWEHASLENVRIGDTRFAFTWNGSLLTVAADRPGWSIESGVVPLDVVG